MEDHEWKTQEGNAFEEQKNGTQELTVSMPPRGRRTICKRKGVFINTDATGLRN